ncbi:WD repeat-containing protein 53 [Podila epigama]|nr:WD repeat-containing protein 53 [Podila epigama]
MHSRSDLSADLVFLTYIPEDKTCRIWDIRTGKVHKALTSFESSVTTTSFTPADTHTIYVGSGQKIYTYDLRMEALILSATESATKIYDGAEDEINQIVMSLQFIPKKDLQALSGGMDKLAVAWDFYKGRATQLIETDTPLPAGVSAKQLFNPPFVHSIAVHPSGTRSAIGLGDGTIQFLHLSSDPPTAPPVKTAGDGHGSEVPQVIPASKKNKKKATSSGGDGWLLGGRLVEAHGMPIASIEYAGFNPDWLVTSASNGTIAIWDEHATRYECSKQLSKGKDEPLPMGRPAEPLTEFRASDVFERLNCVTTSKGPAGESGDANKLFVAGTHPRTGDKKLQGRIAVYHI